MRYDEWKERGCDADLGGEPICNTCLDGLHKWKREHISNPDCVCECHDAPEPKYARLNYHPSRRGMPIDSDIKF